MKANLSTSQILCWNCEEVVHAYASRCPYCTKEVKAPIQSDKITQMHQPAPSPISPPVQAEEESLQLLPDAFTILISLAALLAGSFFLFFGVIIRLFSVNGSFVLEWNVSSWPYFVGSSLVLLTLGLYTLSKLKEE